MTERKKLFSELVVKVKFFESKSELDELLMKLRTKLLEKFSLDSSPSPDVILNFVQEYFPPATTFFCEIFFAYSLCHSTRLRSVLRF